MNLVAVALGANLGEARQTLCLAAASIAAWPDIINFSLSSQYSTAPVGPQDQPDYINAACTFCTALDPLKLLERLQEIERSHGRRRDGARWGPRTLDLDIISYADYQIKSERLSLPHPRAFERAFVLQPLAEIAPSLVIAGSTDVASLLAACPAQDRRTIIRLS